MNLTQQRLVFGWLLSALALTSLFGAQTYPWLYVVFVPLILFAFVGMALSGERRPSWEEHALASRELSDFVDDRPLIKLWIAVCGLAIAATLIALVSRMVAFRIPSNPWVIGGAFAVLLGPLLVAQQVERYRYLGTRSDQPLHSTRENARVSDGARPPP